MPARARTWSWSPRDSPAKGAPTAVWPQGGGQDNPENGNGLVSRRAEAINRRPETDKKDAAARTQSAATSAPEFDTAQYTTLPAHQAVRRARELTAASATDDLAVEVAARFPLDQITHAHDRVDAGGGGRVLLTLP